MFMTFSNRHLNILAFLNASCAEDFEYVWRNGLYRLKMPVKLVSWI